MCNKSCGAQRESTVFGDAGTICGYKNPVHTFCDGYTVYFKQNASNAYAIDAEAVAINCCGNSSSDIATDVTIEVTEPAWNAAVGNTSPATSSTTSSTISFDNLEYKDSPRNALDQLARRTAGILAENATTEKEIKDAVILACTWILSNVQELADWWKAGKNIAVMTFKNTDIYGNTRVTEEQTSRNSKYAFQTASTFASREPFIPSIYETQWVFKGGNYNIGTNSTTQNLMGATSIVQSTLDASISRYNNITNNFTIGYSNEIALEIGLMVGVASRTTTPTEDVKLGAENAYPKDTKDNFSNAISVARADIGIITGIFLQD